MARPTRDDIAIDDLGRVGRASDEEKDRADQEEVVDDPVLFFVAHCNAGEIDGDRHGKRDHEEVATDRVQHPTPPAPATMLSSMGGRKMQCLASRGMILAESTVCSHCTVIR